MRHGRGDGDAQQGGHADEEAERSLHPHTQRLSASSPRGTIAEIGEVCERGKGKGRPYGNERTDKEGTELAVLVHQERFPPEDFACEDEDREQAEGGEEVGEVGDAVEPGEGRGDVSTRALLTKGTKANERRARSGGGERERKRKEGGTYFVTYVASISFTSTFLILHLTRIA